MRILFVAQDIGSAQMGMVFRPYMFAKQLKSRGHQVRCLTASFAHIRRQNPTIDHDLEKTDVEGLQFQWIKTFVYMGNNWRRVLNMFWFSGKLMLFARRIGREFRPDVIVASSPHPLIIFGCWLMAKISGARLIFEVRDIWPQSLIQIGNISPHHPFMKLLGIAEKFAYRYSNQVISLLPHSLDHMKSRGLDERKFVYIPNGIDQSEWTTKAALPPDVDEAYKRFAMNKKVILGYAGAHGVANALDFVLEAMANLKTESIGFVFVGEGVRKAELIKKANSLNLENVLFLPALSRPQVIELMSRWSASFISLKKTQVFEHGVSPNKLMDYAMTGLPVVYAITHKGSAVETHDFGWTVEAENATDLERVLRKVLATPENELKAKGNRAKAWVISDHDYCSLIKAFEKECLP
jgi:glycosyltransferase involved in cell wall biosynthesis